MTFPRIKHLIKLRHELNTPVSVPTIIGALWLILDYLIARDSLDV